VVAGEVNRPEALRDKASRTQGIRPVPVGRGDIVINGSAEMVASISRKRGDGILGVRVKVAFSEGENLIAKLKDLVDTCSKMARVKG